jgi:hypothetical protein
MKHINLFEAFNSSLMDYQMIANRLKKILIPNIIPGNVNGGPGKIPSFVRVDTMPEVRNDWQGKKGGFAPNYIDIVSNTPTLIGKDAGTLIKGTLDSLLARYDNVIRCQFGSSKKPMETYMRYKISKGEPNLIKPDRYYSEPFFVTAPDEEKAVSIIIATLINFWNSVDSLKVYHGDDTTWSSNERRGIDAVYAFYNDITNELRLFHGGGQEDVEMEELREDPEWEESPASDWDDIDFYTNNNTGKTYILDEPPAEGEAFDETITDPKIIGMKNSIVSYLKRFTDEEALSMASSVMR